MSGKDPRLPWDDPGGVVIRPFDAWPYLGAPKIAKVACSEHVAEKTVEFCRGQLGKPFDKKALYAFLRDRAGAGNEGREWRDPDKWFCSELQARGLEWGGLFPYTLIQPKHVISPNTLLLYLNPFLSEDNIKEF